MADVDDETLPPQSGSQINTELAKERNRAAAERTLMAWIRTCLSLISFGFGIDAIISALNKTRLGGNTTTITAVNLVGLGLISLGVYAMIAASLEHKRELKTINREGYYYTSRRSLGLNVSVALVLIGAFAFVAILIDALTR